MGQAGHDSDFLGPKLMGGEGEECKIKDQLLKLPLCFAASLGTVTSHSEAGRIMVHFQSHSFRSHDSSSQWKEMTLGL